MPYVLTMTGPEAGPLEARLQAWPHNALPRRGFVLAIGLSAAILALPLVAVLGSPVLWGLLPFALVVLWGLWVALQRNWRDRRILEEMTFSRRAVTLVRRNPQGPRQEWQADPAWVSLRLVPQGGPVPNYLILGGGGREVELGAYLVPEERARLHDELAALLRRLKSYA